MATKHRLDLSPATAGYLLLASLNVVLVLAGGMAVTRAHAQAPAQPAALQAGSVPTPDALQKAPAASEPARVAVPAAVAAKSAAAKAAKPAPKPSAKPAAKPVTRTVVKRVTEPGGTHVVRDGDTLYQISRQYFGTDAQFYAIYQLNRAAIGGDRSNLPKGVVLKLPPRTREVRTVVIETPKPAPAKPTAAKKPAAAKPAAKATTAPKPVAVRPTEAPRLQAPPKPVSAPAPIAAPQDPMPYVYGAAGLTGAAWLLGGWLLVCKRRRRLDEQRQRFLSGMDARMRLRGAALDPAALHSPWRVAHASAVLDAREPGGAFTDVVALSDSRLGLFVGDATGSAANALLSRGLAVATWRAKASATQAPGETFLALNRLVADQVPQGDHVTAFYAQVDLLSGAVTHAAASHSGAYIVGADGTLTMIGGKGMPLGLGQELFAARMETGVGRLKDGDTLWIFTDGLIKAENAQGEPFGLERLEACLREGARLGPDRLIALVIEAIQAFAGQRPLADDAAMSALRLSPKPSKPAAVTDNAALDEEPMVASTD
jgi:serine phosphatase RsbU (regulator of sigma subunit)/LysM repeat protein